MAVCWRLTAWKKPNLSCNESHVDCSSGMEGGGPIAPSLGRPDRALPTSGACACTWAVATSKSSSRVYLGSLDCASCHHHLSAPRPGRAGGGRDGYPAVLLCEPRRPRRPCRHSPAARADPARALCSSVGIVLGAATDRHVRALLSVLTAARPHPACTHRPHARLRHRVDGPLLHEMSRCPGEAPGPKDACGHLSRDAAHDSARRLFSLDSRLSTLDSSLCRLSCPALKRSLPAVAHPSLQCND